MLCLKLLFRIISEDFYVIIYFSFSCFWALYCIMIQQQIECLLIRKGLQKGRAMQEGTV